VIGRSEYLDHSDDFEPGIPSFELRLAAYYQLKNEWLLPANSWLRQVFFGSDDVNGLLRNAGFETTEPARAPRYAEGKTLGRTSTFGWRVDSFQGRTPVHPR
jgi:hypothetical protein